MKKIKYITLAVVALLVGIWLPSCTDLTEEPFSVLTDDTYFTDKAAVEAAVLRPFQYAHNNAWDGDRWRLQELTGDHFVWTQKGKHGWDEGQWVRLHGHNWDYKEGQVYGSWRDLYKGIGYINKVLLDFEKYDIIALGVAESEKAGYVAQLRVLRAWYYIWLLDLFRYIPIVEDISSMVGQSTPQETFNYIEKEIKEAMPNLPEKGTTYRFTKTAAASLLVRIYFSAGIWVEKPMYTECAQVAQDIIDGKYGVSHSIDPDYRGPFHRSFVGDPSPENIFEFPHKRNYLQLGGMYAPFHHYKSNSILDTDGDNGYNGIHLTPSRDPDGNLYTYKMGGPYEKYADVDYRKQNYEVINENGDTKGFFLVGPQYEFNRAKGYGYDKDKPVTGSEEWTGQQLVFVDQVGRFSEKPGGRWTEGSHVTTGEENSGVRLMKFGPLSHTHSLYYANSIGEIRLAEIYYSLAECKYRAGDKAGAAKLLDAVRKRNYPEAEWSKYSYEANLSMLTDQEFIDEWGREFLGEHRRRIDLIRWNRFGDEWWDKSIDKDDKEYTIFPIPDRFLNANNLLKQMIRGWE